MPIWLTEPVFEQGLLTLDQWSVRELADGHRHLVGYCVENQEGRVSSGVVDFDLVSMCASTHTGRTYVLRGKPGSDPDAEYVWNRWIRLKPAESWTDVSNAIWDAHMALLGSARSE